MKNLQFANKTLEDVEMMRRINEVEALEKLPGGNPLKDDPAYEAVKERGYVDVPRIIPITPTETVHEFSDSDFSPEVIKKRADEGYARTMKALGVRAQAP
jgi:Patatin phospholipase